MKISVIIVNHNTGTTLKECLDSLFRIENPELFETIVVDNNSNDNSEEIIREYERVHSNVRSIFLKKLVSFSYANNRGYNISEGEYILIMNPDIIFTEPVFEKLIENLDDNKKVGAICPMLIGTDNKFQTNYFQRYPSVTQFVLFHSVLMKIFYKFPKLMNKYFENHDIEKSRDEIFYIEQIPGAFFFTTKSFFEKAGKMDESYKLFFEDMDLSYQFGKFSKLAVNTKLRITHLGGVSFKSEDNWWIYSRYIMSMNHFFDKNYDFIRSSFLKIFSIYNSLLIVSLELIKSVFGKKDIYRYKKHKYFLKEFFHYYL